MTGTLALVGGGEFRPAAAEVEELLVGIAGGAEVLVLPTAAAFEHPDRAVANAVERFAALGAPARGLPVLGRPDASEPANVEAVASARFVYLTGGSPMHLRSVLKETPLWSALLDAFAAGAVVAASSAGARVLTDPMVDPRGGAFTIGLGLVKGLAVVPHAESWSHDRMRRTLQLAKGVTLVALEEGAAVVRRADGSWQEVGNVRIFRDGEPAGLEALPGPAPR